MKRFAATNKMHILIKTEVICLCRFMEIPKLISCVACVCVCLRLRRFVDLPLRHMKRIYPYVRSEAVEQWTCVESVADFVHCVSHHLDSHHIQFESCTKYTRYFTLAAMLASEARERLHAAACCLMRREYESIIARIIHKTFPKPKPDLIYWYIQIAV